MEKNLRKCVLKICPYVPGKPIEEVERELGIKEAIKLASNENPIGPSPKVLKAIIDYLPKINRYPDDEGFYLKKVIAKKFGVKQENIILGCGSDEIMELIVGAFVEAGKEVLFGAPSFVMYTIATQFIGGKPVAVPLKNNTYDLETMAKAVTKKTKVVFIANPNNPTGTIVTDAQVRKFLKNIRKDIVVVLDEAYAEYVESGDYPKSLKLIKEYPNCIVLRTFSKIYSLAGLRMGFGLADTRLISCLARVRPPFNTSSIAQVAAITALKETSWAKRVKAINSTEKKFLYKELDNIGLEYVKSQANFIAIKIGKNALKFSQELMKQGVIVRFLASFGLPEYIRVSIGIRKENKKFVSALKKVLLKVGK